MKPRAWFAVGVLVAWGSGLAVFARRELTRPATDRLAEVAMRVSPDATWFAVEREGRHIGFASVTIDTVPRELQFIEYLVFQPDSVGAARRVEQSTIRLSRGLVLRGFESLHAMGSDSVVLRASVDSAGRLAYRVAANGTRAIDSGAVTAPLPLFLPALVPLVAALQAPLSVGATATFSVFDTTEARVVPLTVRVDAESLFTIADSAVAGRTGGRWLAVHRDTVRAWRLRSTRAGVPLDVWVDAIGQPVAATRIDGLTLRRTAFELAFENWRLAAAAGGVAARAGGVLVSGTLLAAGVPLPDRTLDSLRLQPRTPLSRVAASRAGLSFRGRAPWTASRPAPRIIVPRYSVPVEDPAWRRGFHRNLAAEPEIETDDPAIRSLARRLRGDESDPRQIVETTMQWLRDSIAPWPVPAAGAAAALAARRGDANEYARLFAALLRANGVPTRTVSGVLYAGGRLYLHAWNEVFLDQWIQADALLGQLPADGAHLPLLYDTLGSQTELTRLLARLDLRIAGAWGPAAGASAERTTPEVP